MNKNAIQKYAIWARNELIEQVKQRAFQYGITDKGYGDENAVVIAGRVLSEDEKRQRTAFVSEIKRNGFEQAVEEVAYTWFNRFIALRFMEVNDYLPTHVRVFSDVSGNLNPEILKDVLHLELEGLDKSKVSQMLNANQTEELYRYLLLTQCNALNAALPEMFEKLGTYTEMLLPNNILKQDSVLARLVKDIDEDDWKDAVQIIGWMYQYYNTEPKQAVFDGLKKNVKITKEKIPAATQLFTPDWIVRYMVENSLGRLWLESHPNNALKADWKYYLDEAEQTPEVAEKLRVMRLQSPVKSPEDINLIDPCMGSGHILVYAFDVLMQIYESEGYNPRDAAKLILEKNVYGLDIDRRAYQLAYFSLMMKARQYNRRIFTEYIKPQVYYPAGWSDGEEYGSLVKVDKLEPMPELPKEQQITLFDGSYETKSNAWNFKRLLAQKYDAVVTNPPYMGSGGMTGKMASFVEENYTDGKADLFAAFILRCFEFAKQSGFIGLMTSYTWMFLSGYQSIRETVLYSHTLLSLIQPEYHSFFEEAYVPICTFTARKAVTHESSSYIRLEQFTGASIQSEKALEAIADVNCTYRYVFNPDALHVIPGSPLVYWANSALFEQYETCPLIQDVCPPKPGLSTGENDRFLRHWQEVSQERISFKGLSECKWYPINKGGEFRRWYGNHQYIVNWENDGFEIRNFKEKGGRLKSRPQNLQWNFKPTISWSLITTGAISLRFYPSYFMQNAAGICCYPAEDKLTYMLGFMNTKPAQLYASMLSPTMNTNAGDIARIPVVFDNSRNITIEETVNKCITLSRADWDSFETSWDFKMHPLIQLSMASAFAWGDNKPAKRLSSAYKAWELLCEGRFNQLKANEEELNRIFIDIYGLQDELTPDVEEKDVTVRKADLSRDIKSLISYAVGCMFGRYSLDEEGLILAGQPYNERFVYSSSPVSGGGPLYRVQGDCYLLKSDGTHQICTYAPDKDNVLPICDDEYFNDDIMGRFVDFVRVVYGVETLEENLKFIADALGGKGTPREVIRNYFLNDFYKDHCKIYQKRPIYWLFDSGKKNGFKSLIYLHRYQSDLLAKLRTDYVHEQQERYRTQLSHIATALNTATGSERAKLLKQQDKLSEQLKEITAFEEKVHHLADQNIEIDLDDGVKKNYEIFTDVLAKK